MKHSTIQLFNLSTAAAIAFAIATSAFAELTVTGVTARQRWPWNSLVDVDFTVNGDNGEAYCIDISATAEDGAKKLDAKTFASEPIAQSGKKTRVVWDLGADYPDFRADDLQVTVTATPYADNTPVYLVVDISGGASAPRWPVRYTTQAPVHTAGVEDACKTTEIWLKRVKAGTITMGKGNGSSDPMCHVSYTCVLTNDYYLGIFPVTQAQHRNLTGGYASKFTNALYRATRPVDSMRHDSLHYPYFNSANPAQSIRNFNGSCVLGRLRNRTGLGFLLPTQWQWEYACRAGSTGDRYPGCAYRHSGNSIPPSTYEWKSVQGMWSANYGTSYVDAYSPNAWGFYSMLGNVMELCLNRELWGFAKDATLTEPLGPTGTGDDTRKRVAKGGCWNWGAEYSIAPFFVTRDPWESGQISWSYGYRLCLPVWNVKW